jgi:hypothetical protein
MNPAPFPRISFTIDSHSVPSDLSVACNCHCSFVGLLPEGLLPPLPRGRKTTSSAYDVGKLSRSASSNEACRENIMMKKYVPRVILHWVCRKSKSMPINSFIKPYSCRRLCYERSSWNQMIKTVQFKLIIFQSWYVFGSDDFLNEYYWSKLTSWRLKTGPYYVRLLVRCCSEVYLVMSYVYRFSWISIFSFFEEL